MTAIDSPEELFDKVVGCLGAIVRSFNKNDFPEKTIKLIQETQSFINSNLRVLSMSNIEMQLRDSLIEFNENLDNYKKQMFNPAHELSKHAQTKDFIKARNIFKKNLKNHPETLLPLNEGEPSPSTIWKKTFKNLLKILS